MEKSVRVRIPQVIDIDTAIEIYYSKIVLRNKDIHALFGNLGQPRMVKLKELARQKMEEKGISTYDATSVKTAPAFEAWGLDIADLEVRSKKLHELERRRNRA